MRAIQITEFGGPERLALADVPMPQPGPGEVLIRVRAASVNRADLLLRSGGYHTLPPLPAIPGSEVAGEVTAFGHDVDGIRIGTRVVAWGVGGGYAQHTVAAAERVVAIPEAVSYEVAASLPVAWLTARFCVRDLGAATAGDTVLLTAAASGVGTAALQTAVADGAAVIAVVSGDTKANAVRALGATQVIDRSAASLVDEVLRLTDGQGVDLTLDLVGGTTFRDALRATRAGGRVVTLANVALEPSPIDTRDFYPKNLSILGFQFTNRQRLGWDPRPDLRALLEEIVSGRYTVPIDSRLPLERAADAHRRIESSVTIGKVVLDVA